MEVCVQRFLPVMYAKSIQIMLLGDSNSITFSFNSRILNVVFVHTLGTTSCKACLSLHPDDPLGKIEIRGAENELANAEIVSNLQVMWCVIAT